jgi:hypothetical protein
VKQLGIIQLQGSFHQHDIGVKKIDMQQCTEMGVLLVEYGNETVLEFFIFVHLAVIMLHIEKSFLLPVKILLFQLMHTKNQLIYYLS